MKKHMLLFIGLIALINIFHFIFQSSEDETIVTDENGIVINPDSIGNQSPRINLITKSTLSLK